MPAQPPLSPAAPPPLHYLPVGLFGAVIAFTALALAWQAAAVLYGWPALVGELYASGAIALFVALCLAYGSKCLLDWPSVLAEFAHPIGGKLFTTFIVALLLLPLLLVSYSPPLARAVWLIGALLMLAFAWHTARRWVAGRQQVEHAAPVWLLPLVGLLDLPIAAAPLGLPANGEMSLAALAIALFLAPPVLALVLSRLIFGEPLPEALRPSLIMLLAPFAVGFSGYTAWNGQVDAFAGTLYYCALFLLLVLAPALLALAQCCPFRVSWWAVAFPLAALAVAAIRYAAFAQSAFHHLLAQGLLLLVSLIVLGLLLRTVRGLLSGELRRLP